MIFLEKQFNTLEFYKNKVAKGVFLIGCNAIFSAIAACLLCMFFGLYTSTPTWLFVIFIMVGSIEIIGFIFIHRKIFTEQEMVSKNYNILKWAVGTVCIINYTFIINLMPSQLMWASFIFFLINIGLFQDFRMTVCCTIMYAIIICIFFATHSIESLQMVPVVDELVSRVLLFSLGVAGAVMNSYYSGHILANVGQELMDKNTNQLTDIIKKVSELMTKLQGASSALVCIAQEENASMEEISSASTNIVEDNSYMLEQSENSQANLTTLREGVENISEKMQETKDVSSELLEMSISNEKALSNVLEIGSVINESTNHTLVVTQNLQNKVEEIDNLLQLIKSIADETKLLALNASIEAVRAGEEGRGFAVVAEQVKRLSENTANSLQNVNKVICDFKGDTKQVEELMAHNVNQIQAQNKVTNETVDIIREMLKKLKYSAEKIEYVGTLTQKQNDHTEEAVVYNEHVIYSIKEQVTKVDNIAELVEENRKAIEKIIVQIDGLNEIVTEIYDVLE